MHGLIRSLAQTLCDDLVRAEKAKNGKKNGRQPQKMVVNMEAMWGKCLDERMRSASSVWD